MAIPFDPQNPKGFYTRNPQLVAQKLHRFKEAGGNGMSYLFDFDRTLTTSKHTGEDITTWYILHGLLPETAQQQMSTLREHYQPLEIAGELSEADALAWWNSALDLYVKHPVFIKDIEAAAQHVQLRDGTTQLFTDCAVAGVPTVILSAGVSDVITTIVGARGIKPSLILSTTFVLADDGRILGWDRGSMIHILNKREQGHADISHIREGRPYTILLGDSLQDADMVDGDEPVLRIRICDLKNPDGRTREHYLSQSFAAGFDLVLEENLQPLVQLNRWLTSKR
jgi:phosphoserine phosphatase